MKITISKIFYTEREKQMDNDNTFEKIQESEVSADNLNNPNIVKELRRDSNVCGILLLLFFAIQFSATFLLRSFGRTFMTGYSDSARQNILTFVLYVIMYPVGMPILFLVFRKISKKYKDQRIRDCFKKPQMPVGWIIKWIVITIGVCYISTYLSTILFTIIEVVTHRELNAAEFVTDISSPISILTYILALPFFAPIFEELLFRGTIYRNVRKYGPWSMMLICGTIFGLWHLNYQQTIYAAVMGIFACLIFEKTQSIIPTMIIHFIVNSIGFVQLMVISGLDLEKIEAGDISELMSNPLKIVLLLGIGFVLFSFMIAAFILLIIEIVKHRDSFKTEYKCKELSGGKSFLLCISSPVMAAALLFMIGMTVYYALAGR